MQKHRIMIDSERARSEKREVRGGGLTFSLGQGRNRQPFRGTLKDLKKLRYITSKITHSTHFEIVM